MYKNKTVTLKSGRNVVLREPLVSDAETFSRFINGLVDEETFEYSGKQSVKDEKEYIESLIEEIHKQNGVHIIATFNDEKVAGADLTNLGYKRDHVVELQLYVRSDFRGDGIGTLLIQDLENEIKKLSSIKLIILTCFGKNVGAINLYKKNGYQECGRLPSVLFHKGAFDDEIYMYKLL
jgi:RimJ/RimL family protein N-acetyltransferase